MTDEEFVEAFETCRLPKELFHHRDHLRLTWIYLRKYGSVTARVRIAESIRRFATHLGVPEKYHETITVAWFRLVQHAASKSVPFEDMLLASPDLLDQSVLSKYYSKDLLQSAKARACFVEPDLQALPAAPEYFLTSARLGFRCWTERDLPLAQYLWGDARVSALIGGPFSEAQVEQRLRSEITSHSHHGVQYWPTFLQNDAVFVGCAGLRPYRLEDRVYELGFHLRPEYWGRGLANEAAQAVIRYGFESIGAKALFAGHHPQNTASRRVLEKLGFHKTHEEFYPPTGLNHPSYLLTRPE